MDSTPRWIVITALLFTCMHAGDSRSHQEAGVPATSVSIIHLIAAPERFEGKVVRLIGFCRLELEGSAVYLHREDFKFALLEHAVLLDVGWPVAEKYHELTDKYVIIEGRFTAQRRGRVGRYVGQLGDITRFERYPTRAEVEGALRLQRDP